MPIWELTLYIARLAPQHHSEISFGEANSVVPFFRQVPEHLCKMPKGTKQSSSAEAEPEDVIEIEEEVEAETEPYHAINPIEARHHVQRLNKAILMMEAKIEDGEIKDVLKDTIQEIKEAICIVMPSMKEANILDILRSIRDPICLAIHPSQRK